MDIAKLGVAIDPTKAVSGASEAKRALKDIGQTARTELGHLDQASAKAGRSMVNAGQQGRSGFGSLKSAMADSIRNVVAYTASIGLVTAAVGGLWKTISVTRDFQQLNAQLETATGSADNARIAFAEIKKVAAATPFDLQQVTTSFTKLVNYGLEPSRRAIMAYGDTASSMGKSLDQMIEAVADASTGEFERLKEFGIKASKEGDKVTFTFRGVRTEVRATSKDIENYLIGLGQKNLAGGMERQMKTLGGAFSNFGDAWEVMLNQIGEGGLGDLVEEAVRMATDKVSEFTTYLQSGEFATAMAALKQEALAQGIQWEAFGTKMLTTFAQISQAVRLFTTEANTESGEWESYWQDVFNHFPTNLKVALDLAQSYVEYFVQKGGQLSNEWMEMWGKAGEAVYDHLIDSAGNQEAKDALAQLRAQDAANAGMALPSPGTLIVNPDGSYGLDTSTAGPGVLPPKDPTAEEELEQRNDEIIRQADAIKATADAYREQAQAIRDMSYGGPLFNGPPNDGFGGLPPTNDTTDPLKQFQIGGDPSSAAAEAAAKAAKEKAQNITKVAPKAIELKSEFDTLMKEWNAFGTQVDKVATGIASSIADNMTSAISGMIQGTKSAKQAFGEMATAIVNDIIQLTIRMTIYAALSKAFGPAGEAFNVFVAGAGRAMAHSGGEVGKTNLSNTRVPVYHTGGKLSSESMVKVDKGETILTRRRSAELARELEARRQPRDRQGGGNTATIINVLDRNEIADVVAKNPSAVVNALSRNLPQVRRMIMSGQRA